jgi:hypothetical protein
VSGSATLTGVDADVAAEELFKTAFKAALAAEYIVATTSITIGAITETASRRRRLASLTIAYTIVASNQIAATALALTTVDTASLVTATKASYTGSSPALSSMSVTAISTPTVTTTPLSDPSNTSTTVTNSPTSAPTLKASAAAVVYVCNPSAGCNVCGGCCHAFISAESCGACVQETCPNFAPLTDQSRCDPSATGGCATCGGCCNKYITADACTTCEADRCDSPYDGYPITSPASVLFNDCGFNGPANTYVSMDEALCTSMFAIVVFLIVPEVLNEHGPRTQKTILEFEHRRYLVHALYGLDNFVLAMLYLVSTNSI